MTRWALTRCLIVALSFLSITAALASSPTSSFFFWYLYFSPVIIAAMSFGLRGAAIASAAVFVSFVALFNHVTVVDLGSALGSGPVLPLLAQLRQALIGPSTQSVVAVGGEVIALSGIVGLVQNSLLGMVLVTAISCGVGWMVDDRRRQAAIYEVLARTDGLTGVSNYRDLLERLHEELARSRRSGKPCAYLMLDVDGLKAHNDTYGHTAGDRTLKELAEVLRTHIRDVDAVGRYGGDEFGLVLAATDATGATTAAHRLREAVAEHFSREMPSPGVTISIGVAVFPNHGASAEDLIAVADDALYQTKLAGKDGVTLAPTSDRGG